MADIQRRGDLDVRIVNPTTQDGLEITANGDAPTDILRVGGSSLTLGRKTMENSLPVVISSDQYESPYRFCAAEQLYSVYFEWVNVGTTEQNLIYLLNPNGSGKNLVLLEAIFTNYDTISSFNRFLIYSGPTITANGTALTISNGKIKTAPTASIANAYRDSTTSSRGTARKLVRTSGGAAGGNSLILPLNGGMIIEPNNAILISSIADGTNRDTSVYLEWGEV